MKNASGIRRRLNFSTRVFIYLFTSMLFIFAAYNAIFFYIHQQDEERSHLKSGALLCRILADNAHLSLFSGKERQFKAMVESITPLEGISALRVFDSQGRLIFHHINGDSTTPSTSPDRKMNPADGEAIPLGLDAARLPIHYDIDGRLRFWVPVLADPDGLRGGILIKGAAPRPIRILGYLSIDLDKSTANQETHDFIIGEVLAAAFFIVLTGILSFIIVRSATVPLKTLLARVQGKIGQKENNRDEFGILTRVYDDLIAGILEKFESIDNFSRSLEEEVNSRTKELNLANIQMHDAMTELKETQAQVVQAEKMAAVGLLVAGVAHEINNTINLISGAIPPLEKNLNDLKERVKAENDGEVDEICANLSTLMHNITEGAIRTSEIVKNLQEFSRPHPHESQLISPHRILETTMNLMRPKLKGQIEVIRDLKGDESKIQGYPGQLGQVLINIILNGIQAIKGSGKLKISTLSDDSKYRIKIADDGPGIPPEVRPRVFDPFFTTKGVGQGTGLGLSVSYSIIREHGGELKINPSPFESGCEFEIILPIAESAAGGQEGEPEKEG